MSDIEDQEIVLSGYYSCRLDRNRHGGGLVIFYKSTLGYKPVLSGSDDLELSTVSLLIKIIAEFVSLYFTDHPVQSSFLYF